MRLGLLAFAPPVGVVVPGCSDSAEESGTSTGTVNGFATQRAVAFTLVPRLTLLGYSRLGCPVDAIVGGGLVYSAPISQTASFAFSGGALYRPHKIGVPGPEPSPVRGVDIKPDARADVVVDRGAGRSLSVGVGLLTKAISVGGLW